MRSKKAFNILKRSKLSLAVLAVGSGFLLGDTAIAQNEELEEITITGSRIRQATGMAEPTPVTAITFDELVDFNPGSTVAQQLDALPQFFATQTGQRSTNSISTTGGGSYLNMRGMGANRTLVLLNGTRVVPADSYGSVNIDNFPTALMQRVDVVTGGASAAYGADAVAGVVNFVLNREFEGFRSRISTGISERMDGENHNISIAAGKGFMDGRLHLIGSVDARKIAQIGPDRDRHSNWQEWGLVRNPEWVSATDTPNIPQRITVPNVFGAQTSPQGLITSANPGFVYRNWTFTDDGTGIRPYAFGDYLSLAGVTPGVGAQNNQSGGHEYNTWELSTRRGVRGNEVVQRSFFFAAKYDVNDRLTVHSQSILGRSESNFYGQPSNMAIAGPAYAWTISRENPFLPQQLTDEMDRLGMDSVTLGTAGVVDGPGLINIYDNRGDRSIGQLQSHTLGFDFDIDNNWHLAGNVQRGKSKVATGILNVPRLDKFFLAMDAVRHPESGEIVCNIAVRNPSAAELAEFMEGRLLPSPLSPDGVPGASPIGPLNPQECVPFNPLGLGNANQAAKDWILDEEKKQYRILDQDFAELLLTGVVHEGWGAGPISLAAGLTWRDETFTQVNFPHFGERGLLNAPELGIRNIPSGFAGPGNRSLHPFSAIGVGNGDRSVWEWFSEVNIPLWEWDTGQRIGSTLAYRSSDYRAAGRQESWKLGFDAQIIDSLRWRITRSSDIREPNFAEVFLTGVGGGDVIDRFRDGERNNSLTVLALDNPELGAETGRTLTTGIVWQPTFAEWIDGLQVSVDWYDIQMSGAVAAYGAQRIIDDCFETGAASACELIMRFPTTDGSTGIISRILNKNINADLARTRGVDLEVMYVFEPNFFANESESFTIRSLFGYLAENSTTTAAGAKQDLAGSQGILQSRPQYQGNVTANYSVGPWGLMLQGNYQHKMMNNFLWTQGVDIDDNWIASQTTFNMAASYRGEMTNGMQWRAAFNVTNLLDRAPSIVAGTGGQSMVFSHDQYGRRYNLSLNLDF